MIAAAGHPHQPRRQDLARRRRRPRHGQDLRVRRRGARRRRRGQRRSRRRTATVVRRATSSRSTARTGEVFLGEVPVVAVAGRASTSRARSTADDATTWSRPSHRLMSARRRARAGCGCAPTPTPPRTPRGPAGSAPRASACAAPSTCSSATAASCVERLILADDDDEREAALARAAAAAARGLHRHLRGDGRAAGHRSGCSTRRCTSSCPTSPSCRSGSRSPRRRGEPSTRTSAAARGRAPAARAEPDARPARRAARPRRSRACSRCRCGRSPRPPPSAQQAGGDPRPEIMVPLVGAVQELEIGRATRRSRSLAEVASETGVRARRSSIGTMIELPRAALTAGADRRGRRVLLLRHQRPDPDDAGASPATTSRRAFFSALPRARASSASRPFETLDRDGVGRLVRIAAEEGRATRPGPQARRLRRARRRPRLGALLPRGRARLRLLLAVPGAGRAAGGRPRGRGRAEGSDSR